MNASAEWMDAECKWDLICWTQSRCMILIIDTFLANVNSQSQIEFHSAFRPEILARFRCVNYLLCRRQSLSLTRIPITGRKHRMCVRIKYSWRKSVLASDMTLGEFTTRKDKLVIRRETGNSDFSWEYAWLEAITLRILLSIPQNTKRKTFSAENAINKIKVFFSFFRSTFFFPFPCRY